ncbi:hypothetical protein [Mesobacillus harenae]|uniref:hypothetical protein n=1 Tax=Mesobacillus harenae TaxID=2213203 RepID=UPI00158047DF|nr:hypothetical protein [Mesobacillus harenae]
MLRRMTSYFLVGAAGYYAYQNRYRLMNGVLGNTWVRQRFVGSLMGIPGLRNKMMQSVFSGPQDIR